MNDLFKDAGKWFCSKNQSIGRVDVLLLDTGIALVRWMEARDGESQRKAVKVIRDGLQKISYLFLYFKYSSI